VTQPSVESIVGSCRSYRGFSRKRSLADVLRIVGDLTFDDAGSFGSKGGKIVASTDGIVEDMVKQNPFMAGFYSVVVNVNDVVAKGARPIGYLNVMSSPSKRNRISIAQGIRLGLRRYDLRLLKGHVHPDQSYESIDATVIGVANRIISSCGAKIGDQILVAIDLDGSMASKAWVKCFDSVLKSSRKQVLRKISSMRIIAEKRLASASRDVSGPGVLGSLAMMCESSKVGARCILERIPRPKTVDLMDWLTVYPSIAFIVATRKPDECSRVFRRSGLTVGRVGVVDRKREVTISYGDRSAVFVDLRNESMFGLR